MPSATCQQANGSRGAADHFWCQGLCARTETACARQHFSKEMRSQCSSQALGEGRQGRGKELPPCALYPVVGAKQRKPDLGKCVNVRPWQAVPFHTTQQLKKCCQGHGTSSPCRFTQSGKVGKVETQEPFCILMLFLPFLGHSTVPGTDKEVKRKRCSHRVRKCWAQRDPQESSSLTSGSA